MDESGVPENANTSHFVLVGLAIPAADWKVLDSQIRSLKMSKGLADAEVHTAWMNRRFVEQERISDFENLSWRDRRVAVQRLRTAHLIRLAGTGTGRQLQSAKKNYQKTEPYLHLTLAERVDLLHAIADAVGNWQDVRLFAEAVNKSHVYLRNPPRDPFELAFTELVQRFEYFLRNRGNFLRTELLGCLVQDNNETVARRLTSMMLQFHQSGTKWTNIDHIVETPLFVDSQLTSMVQLADLAGYAIRRYYENDETDLLDRLYSRFDRTPQGVVGIRHFTAGGCQCRICMDH